jgi:hypothetical protein
LTTITCTVTISLMEIIQTSTEDADLFSKLLANDYEKVVNEALVIELHDLWSKHKYPGNMHCPVRKGEGRMSVTGKRVEPGPFRTTVTLTNSEDEDRVKKEFEKNGQASFEGQYRFNVRCGGVNCTFYGCSLRRGNTFTYSYKHTFDLAHINSTHIGSIPHSPDKQTGKSIIKKLFSKIRI